MQHPQPVPRLSRKRARQAGSSKKALEHAPAQTETNAKTPSALASLEQLRQFDLHPRYGPCMGIGRRFRWQRGCSLGLDPPAEIKEILDDKTLEQMPNLDQSIWDSIA